MVMCLLLLQGILCRANAQVFEQKYLQNLLQSSHSSVAEKNSISINI